MEARELRIGNYVHPLRENDGLILPEILIVLEIISIDYPKSKVCPITHDVHSFHKTPKFDTKMLSPIPLTEKWIIDFGFERYSENHFQLNILQRSTIHCYTEKHKVRVELGNKEGYSFGYPNVENVHELQNLYFALTGQELERK